MKANRGAIAILACLGLALVLIWVLEAPASRASYSGRSLIQDPPGRRGRDLLIASRTPTSTSPSSRQIYLPLVIHQPPRPATPTLTSSATATATTTDTGTPAATPTPTATGTATPGATSTSTATGTSTATSMSTPTPTATPTPTPSAGCTFFPANNVWNRRVDALPVDPNSSTYVNTIGASTGLHPDFGSGLWDGGPMGIPYTTVPGSQPLVPMTFGYADESDPGPYPFPADAPIEGGPPSTGDRHVLVVETDNCDLYETWNSWPTPDGSWYAGSGARFDLDGNALRPAGWTSADAAGLPILPGLVRFDEVASGRINHSLRFTAPQTRRAYVWPARHFASSLIGAQYPPMGQRFRLKASFNVSGFSATNQVILRALKEYGMFLADNGSAWFLSGAPDVRWDNDDLHQLQVNVHGSDFEVVDESSLMVDPNSGEARQ